MKLYEYIGLSYTSSYRAAVRLYLTVYLRQFVRRSLASGGKKNSHKFLILSFIFCRQYYCKNFIYYVCCHTKSLDSTLNGLAFPPQKFRTTEM